ncbi:SpoVA/SpoVAEb family sporulation membrane protein, partial [Bacillus mycoides]|uniref:SpoVA/SpoVAEb family sporulation membrane protein n=1 Tax=Bacillus mycoides TaxID=1405 RepID=UPI002847883D
MDLIYALLVGGVSSVLGTVLLDFAKLTQAHLMATFVVAEAILDGFGLYDKLIKFAGARATVTITSFGPSLLH